MVLIKKYFAKMALPFVYKINGLDVYRYIKWINSTMQWSHEQREAWKLERLNYMLEFCWKNVPFYKEYWNDYGLAWKKLQNLEELKFYPILRKDVLKSNIQYLKPKNIAKIRCQIKNTGGTTGVPISYLQDLEQWSLMQAFHLWGWGQAGYKIGDQVAVIAGGSLVPEKLTFKDKLRSIIENKLFLFGVHMDNKLALKYYKKIRQFNAQYLYGYPSIISAFATCISEQNLFLDEIKAVITTAEMLQPQYRHNIEQTFHCKVFDDLGCNDGGYESYECYLHNGLHYNDFQSILEIEKMSPDKMGHLLITNLWNKSTPFIRYENGDLIELSDSPCPCGQAFPLIKSISGRTMDILRFSNAKILSGPALTLIFRDMDIDGWQVVQRSFNHIEVRLCSRRPIAEAYISHIIKILHHHLGDDVKILISRVDELKYSDSGKLKPVWIEFDVEEN